MQLGLPTTDARSHAPGRSPLAEYVAANNATAHAPAHRETHTKKEKLTRATLGFPGRAAELEPDGCKETGQSAPKSIEPRGPPHHPPGLHPTSGSAAKGAPVSVQAASDFVAL